MVEGGGWRVERRKSAGRNGGDKTAGDIEVVGVVARRLPPLQRSAHAAAPARRARLSFAREPPSRQHLLAKKPPFLLARCRSVCLSVCLPYPCARYVNQQQWLKSTRCTRGGPPGAATATVTATATVWPCCSRSPHFTVSVTDADADADAKNKGKNKSRPVLSSFVVRQPSGGAEGLTLDSPHTHAQI